MFIKPDSVQPKTSRNKLRVVSIISLQTVLPQFVKPPTRFRMDWDVSLESFLGLLHIEIARFTVNLITFVTVALIVGSPRVVISHYAVPSSPDFPLNQAKSIQLCSFAPICVYIVVSKSEFSMFFIILFLVRPLFLQNAIH